MENFSDITILFLPHLLSSPPTVDWDYSNLFWAVYVAADTFPCPFSDLCVPALVWTTRALYLYYLPPTPSLFYFYTLPTLFSPLSLSRHTLQHLHGRNFWEEGRDM